MPPVSDGVHYALIPGQQAGKLRSWQCSENVQRHDLNFHRCHCQMKVITLISVERLLTFDKKTKKEGSEIFTLPGG